MVHFDTRLPDKYRSAAKSRPRRDTTETETVSREHSPIVLEYGDEPDQFVPKTEWAVVNVSGQRFHLNMDHIKRVHHETLLGSKGTCRLKNGDERGVRRFKRSLLYYSSSP